MDTKDFDIVFDQLDSCCRGYIDAGQLQEFHKSVYHNVVPISEIDRIILEVGGVASSGKIKRELFLTILLEIDRRQTIQENAYWDFKALDSYGLDRIDLKDALVLFQEFHGEMFSLEMWNKFVSSRDYQDYGVSYDEIKLWLCEVPAGLTCSAKEFEAEEKRLEKIKEELSWQKYDSRKQDEIVFEEDDEEEVKEIVKSPETSRKSPKLEVMVGSVKDEQWSLAKERLMAARSRLRRPSGFNRHEEKIEENIENIINKTRLQEILLILKDRNHEKNRNFLIKLLEDVGNEVIADLENQTTDNLEIKISEATELRSKWKESSIMKPEDEISIFKETCCYTVEVKGRDKGKGYDLDEIKIDLLAGLQHLQDIETRKLKLQIPLKDIPWLKDKITELKEGYLHDNVATILFLGQGQPVEQTANKDESAVIAALEKKYDVMRDKLIVEALMKEMGHADWNRLSQLERQKKVVHIKLQNRKLRREGKMESQISDLIGRHLQDAKAVDTLLGTSKIHQQRRFDEKLSQRRLRKLERENTMEFSREGSSAEDFQRHEEKQEMKRNILENLEKQLEADKERLLSSLRGKTNKVERAKARWKLLAKLQRESKLLQAEDDIDSAVLVFNIGSENVMRRETSFIEEHKLQRELAKERLQTRTLTRKCSLEENQKDIYDNLQEERKSPRKRKTTKDKLMDYTDLHHHCERDVLMKLLNLVEENKTIKVEEKTDEEIKTCLATLQQEQSKIQAEFQQVSHSVNVDKLDKSEEESYYMGVAKRRSEQFKHLSEAIVYRIELDLRMLRGLRPVSTKSDLFEELSILLLADLQERQENESNTLQNIIVEKDDKTLEQMRSVQKVGEREGWYNNLSLVIFTLNFSIDERDLVPDITREIKHVQAEFEREKKDITDTAINNNKDPTPLIEALEEHFEGKKQAMIKNYEAQCLEIKEKLAAKKTGDKKGEMKGDNQQIDEIPAEDLTDCQPDENKTISKTPLLKQVETDEDQKQAMFMQLARQDKTLQTKISDQQKQQEEMLHRRLEARRRESSRDRTELSDLGERQKAVLAKAESAEKIT